MIERKEDITLTKVLVSPLDWGLGHATRCIPVIKAFIEEGAKVTIGGSGQSLQLLSEEFRTLNTISIPGFSPEYPATGLTSFTLFRQLPSFLNSIKTEHRTLKKQGYAFDIIVSDNRYGVYSDRSLNIFLSHQLSLPPGPFRPFAQLFQESLVKPFDMFWVPDIKSDQSLAGKLSENKKFGNHIRHTGWLSRLESGNKTTTGDIAIILSGPEPLRTAFEEELITIFPAISGKKILVRGTAKQGCKTSITENIEVFNLADSTVLNEVFANSEIIICRSGYSTLMDIMKTGKKAILIPTPGQPEQQYLADNLSGNRRFRICRKPGELPALIEELKAEPDPEPVNHDSMLRNAVKEVMEKSSLLKRKGKN